MTLAAIAFSLAAAIATATGPPTGRWSLQGSPTVFRFEPCAGATACGVLESSARIQADADARDVKNRKPSQRSRRLKGLTVFENLQPAGAGVWKGRVYLPGAGTSYAVTVTQTAPDILTAKGCAAPLLCQTSALKRLP